MTPDVWILELPGHPPSRNDRLHWRTAHRISRHWKGLTMLKAREAGIPACTRVRLSLVVLRRALGVSDPDNDACRLKHLVDGLVAAGVITDDTYRHVELGPVSEQRGPKSVRLFVQRIKGDEIPATRTSRTRGTRAPRRRGCSAPTTAA